MAYRPLGIYVHIPFCVRKCAYCDFNSFSANEETVEVYIAALEKEIMDASEKHSDSIVKTIYFGGGTPSSISAGLIGEVLEVIRTGFKLDENPEITLEVNPGTVTERKVSSYYKMGINRISIGLQSFNDDELKLLGRIHTSEQFEECYRMFRAAGFKNISVDVISALPGQSMDKYRYTLEKVISLQPEHISSYSLIIEPGTPFFEKYGENACSEKELPDEELEREMYYVTRDMLRSAGYEKYEISNYAKPGYESRHNSSYWTGTDYLGFGLGASSYIEETRFHNADKLNIYIEEVFSDHAKRYDEEKLQREDLMAEYMILGLRMAKGVSVNEFAERFKNDIYDVYGNVIEKYMALGFLEKDGDRMFLNDRGMDVSNTIMADFMPE